MSVKLEGTSVRELFEKALNHQLLPDRRFNCPRCRTTALPTDIRGCEFGPAYFGGTQVVKSSRPQYTAIQVACAACGDDTIFLRRWRWSEGVKEEWLRRVEPQGLAPRSFPSTDPKYTRDYEAACRTLEVSPEASACMSRRCLQHVLHDQGYTQRDLAPQIDAVLAEPDPRRALPRALFDEVDAVRQFGNFGAHPQRDQSSKEILPVEPGEAEWCIQIVEGLFNHFFEHPAASRAKIASANQKLAAAGKPKIKSSGHP